MSDNDKNVDLNVIEELEDKTAPGEQFVYPLPPVPLKGH